jgi:hypothetical protein
MSTFLKSDLTESLSEQPNPQELIFTSTRNEEIGSDNVLDKPGRKAMLPVSNKSVNNQINVGDMNDQEAINLKSDQQLNTVIHSADRQDTFTTKYSCKTTAPESFNEIPECEDQFDSFLLHHFTPYSGSQDLNDWLDKTEDLFNHFKFSRQLRFEAIPLLVKDDVKRLYISHRRNIQTFDDFYEFLITNFSCKASTLKLNSSSINKDVSSDTYDVLKSRSESSTVHEIAHDDRGATKTVGVIPAEKSTTISSDCSTHILDQTTNELRRAIVRDLVSNPKYFRGTKDDVQKWMEDTEHLLDIAHIPESSRLDLISYSLKGDALQWYKTNKASFTTWKTFTNAIKKAFTSSFHSELAFQKLECYAQTENQSIRNFFNETLKLCKEADSTMSEATKLKNLLNKAKPSIQFEVRKKKPTNTAEFLEYAKDVEELYQLTNINVDHLKKNTPTTTSQISTGRQTTPTSNNNSTNHVSSSKSNFGYTGNWNNHINNKFKNNFQNGYDRYNDTSSSRSPSSFQNQNGNSNSRWSTNRNNSSFPSNGNNRFSSQPNRSSSSNSNQSRSHTANTVYPSDSSTNIEPDTEAETLPDTFCTQCQLYGHDISSCQNFE